MADTSDSVTTGSTGRPPQQQQRVSLKPSHGYGYGYGSVSAETSSSSAASSSFEAAVATVGSRKLAYQEANNVGVRPRTVRHNSTGVIGGGGGGAYYDDLTQRHSPHCYPNEGASTSSDVSEDEYSGGRQQQQHGPTAGGGGGEGVALSLRQTSSKLRRLFLAELKSDFFGLGLVSGASLQMFAVSMVLMFASYSHSAGSLVELSHEYYPVFRCVFMIALFFTLYGTDLLIWRRMHINYHAVLGVSVHHSYQYVIRGAASIAYIVFTCFLMYILTITGMLDNLGDRNYVKHIWPALAVFLPAAVSLCPVDGAVALCFGSRSHGFEQRWGLVREIAAVLAAPFSETTFARSFIADIFCSMPKIFMDLEYTACLYVTDSFWDTPGEWLGDKRLHMYDKCGAGSHINLQITRVLSFLPFLTRLLQSLRAYRDTRKSRHLFNGLKYCMSLSVTGVAIYRSVRGETLSSTDSPLGRLWLGLGVVTTLYAFFWDTVMDWGLCQFVWGDASDVSSAASGGDGAAEGQHPYAWLLRKKLYFKPKVYFAAMALNLTLRLGWAILISPEQAYVQQNFVLVFGSLELIRRCLWAVFRVEWEHICVSEKRRLEREKQRDEFSDNSHILGQEERQNLL